MTTHYKCRVLSQTGQPLNKDIFRPGFYEAYCLHTGGSLDAPDTLNTGSVCDGTLPFVCGWTQARDFVMRERA